MHTELGIVLPILSVQCRYCV